MLSTDRDSFTKYPGPPRANSKSVSALASFDDHEAIVATYNSGLVLAYKLPNMNQINIEKQQVKQVFIDFIIMSHILKIICHFLFVHSTGRYGIWRRTLLWHLWKWYAGIWMRWRCCGYKSNILNWMFSRKSITTMVSEL